MNDADARFHAALNHLDAGRLHDAARELAAVVQADPNHADALHELGLLYHRGGQPDGAVQLLKRAADLRPGEYRFQYNLAAALKFSGRMREALPYFRRAALLPGADADLFNVIGNALRETGELEEAEAALRRALELRPRFAFAENNLGTVLQDQGRTKEAVAAFRRALEIDPRYANARSNLLLCLNYLETVTDEELLAEHRAFGDLFSPPGGAAAIPLGPPRGDGRIRVGYLSPDFRQHSVAFFIHPVLANHDRSKVHVTCYSDVAAPDVMTQLMQRHAEQWRQVAGMDGEKLAALVAADEIDILVELAGHTGGNRLPLLARRIAPIQVTYLGYPNTTGLSSMDYRITDAIADPPGMTEAQYTEQLVRLPRAFFAYLVPSGVPDVAPLPAPAAGHVTFAVFTNFAKVRPAMIALWARVLRAVPKSRLLIQAKSLNDAATRARTAQFLADNGVPAERLELRGWVDFPVYTQLFAGVDIVLDTAPFAGHTTSCHALLMGAPLVTLAGQSHRSRMGASLLTNVGLPELVARDESDFVRVATELAGDLPRLAALRASLRERLTETVADGRRFARDLEDGYAIMIAARRRRGGQ